MLHWKQLKYFNRFSPMFIYGILVCIIIYLVFILLIFLLQDHLVFFPDKQMSVNPKLMLGLAYEDIYFKTDDGVILNGWFIPAEKEEGVILFCHGNAGNISHRLESIIIFNRLNLSVFIFDYRGYGRSKGKPSEQGTYLDATAAWHYLCNMRRIKSEKIIIFGRSLGASIAAWLAKEKLPAGIILESSFTSIPELGSKIYPFLPVRLLSRLQYNTAQYVQKIHCNKLFIHSKDDDIIPYVLGEKNFRTALPPKQFLTIHGSHNEGFIQSIQIYQEGLNQFIYDVVNQ